MFHFRLLYVAVCFLMQSTKFPFQLTYIGKCFYYSKRRIHSLLAFQYSSQHIQSSLREYGRQDTTFRRYFCGRIFRPQKYHFLTCQPKHISGRKLIRIFLTASFTRLVSTPYNSAVSASNITTVSRTVIILPRTCSNILPVGSPTSVCCKVFLSISIFYVSPDNTPSSPGH